MAEDNVVVIDIQAEGAIYSVEDLRNNIKGLKKELDGMAIGTTEYEDTLKKLTLNQNALKNAMHATALEGETQAEKLKNLTAAADGTQKSYNGLVAKMAQLKEQLRATDTSTDAGKAKFKALADEINSVNDQLKEMDALQGNYQRNVGNYSSALDGLGDILKSMPPTLGETREKIGRVGDTMKLVGKTPILGIIGLLYPILQKIVDALTQNDTAIKSVKKAMDALQPVMTAVEKVIQWMADGLASLADKFVEFVGSSGDGAKKIVGNITGVGNAILQYLLTPVRTAIEAFKGLGNIIKDVFAGDWAKVKEDAANAWKGITDSFKKGFSFKENFNIGKEAGVAFADGLKAEVKKEAEAVTKEVLDEETLLLEKKLALAKKYSDEYFALLTEQEKLRHRKEQDELKSKGASNLLLELNEKLHNKAIADIEKQRQDERDKAIQAELDARTRLSEQIAKQTEDALAQEREKAALLTFINESTTENTYLRQKESLQINADMLFAQAEALQAAIANDDLFIDEKERFAAELSRINASIVANSRQMAENEAKVTKEWVNGFLNAASDIGTIFNAVADIYQQDIDRRLAKGEIDEEQAKQEFETVKAFQLSTATLTMLAGVAGALASPFLSPADSVLPTAAKVALAALTASAQLASGIAQITKIANTQYSGSGSSASSAASSAVVAAPAVSTPAVTQVSQVTNATEEDRLNAMASDQKVYLVMSDLEAKQNSIKVQTQESSF